MNEFKSYHPIVNFTYFVLVIIFSCIFMHPVCLLISFVSGFTYSLMTGGKKALKFNLIFALPMMVVTAVMNPVFNHQGVTILSYFPSGNPLTLESVIYGIAAAVMLICVILHFSSYNKIMSSDKFIYLFGRIMPSLSLILSMILRFVPAFKKQFLNIVRGQQCIGKGISSGSLLHRLKNCIRIFGIMLTSSLENSVNTADSMKSRGYGLPGRTAYSNFKFCKRDAFALGVMLFSSCYLIAASAFNVFEFVYFPSLKYSGITLYTLSVFAVYLLLCMVPVIIEIREVLKWK